MVRSTQETRLSTVVGGNKDDKLTGTQQKQWASMVVGKMTKTLQSKSINQVLWGDQKKK